MSSNDPLAGILIDQAILWFVSAFKFDKTTFHIDLMLLYVEDTHVIYYENEINRRKKKYVKFFNIHRWIDRLVIFNVFISFF